MKIDHFPTFYPRVTVIVYNFEFYGSGVGTSVGGGGRGGGGPVPGREGWEVGGCYQTAEGVLHQQLYASLTRCVFIVIPFQSTFLLRCHSFPFPFFLFFFFKYILFVNKFTGCESE